MATRLKRLVHPFEKEDEPDHRKEYLLAFAIGALVGVGLAATWIPEKNRARIRAGIGEGYQRMRRASRRLTSDFREELASGLEAAREEFRDMTRQQIRQMRKTLQRERKRLGR
ncbi:MAG: hypothetical protein PVI01_06005 [Gemmatimonadales bacterium]|jgi:hypothetical protein